MKDFLEKVQRKKTSPFAIPVKRKNQNQLGQRGKKREEKHSGNAGKNHGGGGNSN